MEYTSEFMSIQTPVRIAKKKVKNIELNTIHTTNLIFIE